MDLRLKGEEKTDIRFLSDVGCSKCSALLTIRPTLKFMWERTGSQ